MCGPLCTGCDKHVYAHGPGQFHGMCLTCYVTEHPEKKAEYTQDKHGRWINKPISGSLNTEEGDSDVGDGPA